MTRRPLCPLVLAALAPMAVTTGAAQTPPELPAAPPRPAVVALTPGTPNLFVDDYLIESQDKLIRRLGEVRKYEGNPVISPTGIWEETAAFPFGGGAYRLEDGTWQLWYNTYVRWLKWSKDATNLCLATSKDGLHWEKPNLRLHRVRGSRDNNVVLSAAMDNASVLYDPDEPDPGRRYKAVVYSEPAKGAGLYGYVSPDAVHWSEMESVLIKDAGDRTSLWHDTLHKRYVLFTRYGPVMPGRYVIRSESEDFVHWSEPELILHRSAIDSPQAIEHYGADGFVYGDMYLGFLEMFHVPYRRLDTQLICSRDGRAWQRVCEPEVFLGNGPEGAFDHFWAFPASTPPIRVGDELWMYYSGRGHPHGSPAPPIWPGEDDSGKPHHSYWAATGLAKMRLDGFAAMDASGEVGTLTTVPLTFAQGAALHLNADADNYPAGSSWLKVRILAEDSTPIEGYEVDRSDTLNADSVDHTATWGGKADIAPLAGRTIRLQFQYVNTRLYSFTVR